MQECKNVFGVGDPVVAHQIKHTPQRLVRSHPECIVADFVHLNAFALNQKIAWKQWPAPSIIITSHIVIPEKDVVHCKRHSI